jgi:hypothetical protein
MSLSFEWTRLSAILNNLSHKTISVQLDYADVVNITTQASAIFLNLTTDRDISKQLINKAKPQSSIGNLIG